MRPTRANSLPKARYSAALAAVSLALLLQCLAPPGYMAGSLDDGWPVVLCPEGLPAGFLGHHGHHHGEESAEDLSLDGYCPLGGMLDTTTAVQAVALADGSAAGLSFQTRYRAPLPTRRVHAHPARAPPVHV